MATTTTPTIAPDPIKALIRTTLDDLQPRLSITRQNIASLTAQLESEKTYLTELEEQEAAYRTALGEDED